MLSLIACDQVKEEEPEKIFETQTQALDKAKQVESMLMDREQERLKKMKEQGL